MSVDICPFCGQDGKPLYMWQVQPGNQIILAPGQTAAIDLNWASKGESCQWADWTNISFNWSESIDFRKFADFLFIPNEWPMHICSPVRSYGYRAETDSPFMGEGAGLSVSLQEKTVYSDERATLHVELTNPTRRRDEPDGCASLYAVRHSADLERRLEPLPTVNRTMVLPYTPEQISENKDRAWPEWKKDFLRACDIAGGATTADAEIAASDLAQVTHIEWRTAPVRGGVPTFLIAPAHVKVLDVDTLAPNWGEPVDGVRAGLSVDRERFVVGEHIPLHLRWEDVGAKLTLASGECGDPQPELEIQDAEHQVLMTMPTSRGCRGHGWGPFAMAKGKPFHNYAELTTGLPRERRHFWITVGSLPRPGVYYLVAVWSPRKLDQAVADGEVALRMRAGRMGDVYTTAHSSPVRIEVEPVNLP